MYMNQSVFAFNFFFFFYLFVFFSYKTIYIKGVMFLLSSPMKFGRVVAVNEINHLRWDSCKVLY